MAKPNTNSMTPRQGPGSTRALACSDRRPRRSVEGVGESRGGGWGRRARVFREGAKHSTRGACAPQTKTRQVRRRSAGVGMAESKYQFDDPKAAFAEAEKRMQQAQTRGTDDHVV